MRSIRLSDYVVYVVALDRVFFKPVPNPRRKPFLNELRLRTEENKNVASYSC